jgi:hypothetical protein
MVPSYPSSEPAEVTGNLPVSAAMWLTKVGRPPPLPIHACVNVHLAAAGSRHMGTLAHGDVGNHTLAEFGVSALRAALSPKVSPGPPEAKVHPCRGTEVAGCHRVPSVPHWPIGWQHREFPRGDCGRKDSPAAFP